MKRSKNKISLVLFGLLLSAGLILNAVHLPAQAAPQLQLTVFPTPTPRPDGRIIYVVQPGDTLWRVSAITGVSLDELRTLNNLGADQPILEGQELLLGLAGPAEIIPTAGPSPTPEPLLPTNTPQPGSGSLCVLVFNDRNGDSVRQEDEASIPGGAISVTDRGGEISITETTVTGMDPLCLEELPQGDYNVSVAVPEGYNPTTVMNYALSLEPGALIIIDFGAQPNSETMATSPPPTGSGNSPLLGILGVVLLIGGAGLGVFAGRMRKTSGQENR